MCRQRDRAAALIYQSVRRSKGIHGTRSNPNPPLEETVLGAVATARRFAPSRRARLSGVVFGAHLTKGGEQGRSALRPALPRRGVRALEAGEPRESGAMVGNDPGRAPSREAAPPLPWSQRPRMRRNSSLTSSIGRMPSTVLSVPFFA
jgi:hypothetical protein